MKHLITLIAALGLTCTGYGQVNSKGTFQLGLGASLGVFNTHFEYSATYPVIGRVSKSSEDGAATASLPLDLQVGLSDRFSLGVCLEPGHYIDSAGTHPNGFFIFSIEPRFYVLNKERFAVHINADLGLSALRIRSGEGTSTEFDDSYAGGHFRFGAQAQYYFGHTFGLNFGFKLASHALKWRDRDPEDTVLNSLDYDATLKTGGVQFQLGAQVKF
jgi:hypothetical protein